MDELIRMRLEILRDAGEISGSVQAAVEGLLIKLEDKYSFAVTEDNGAMFVTHLAAPLNRIEKGETIEAIETSLLEEARETPYWRELPQLLEWLEQETGLKIPEQERGYLALHLAVMLEKAKGGEDN
jgi:transcriptional regulatory protein LevR